MDRITHNMQTCTGTTVWTLIVSLPDANLDWKKLIVNKMLFNFVYLQKKKMLSAIGVLCRIEENLPNGAENAKILLIFIEHQHSDVRYWYRNFIHPSICHVPVLDENSLTYCHSFFHHTVAQSFWFYQHQTSSRNSDGVTPCVGTKYRPVGYKNFAIFYQWSLYLAYDTR